MSQNDGVVRSESPPPRRGRRRGKRTWVTVDGTPTAGGPLRPRDPGPRDPEPPTRPTAGRPAPARHRVDPRRPSPNPTATSPDAAIPGTTTRTTTRPRTAARPPPPSWTPGPPTGRHRRRPGAAPAPGRTAPRDRARAGPTDRSPPPGRAPPSPDHRRGRAGRRDADAAQADRHPGGRAAQPPAHPERDPRLPPRGQRRRRRPLRADRAHLRHDDDLRGGRGGRGGAGQHAVLRGRDRGEQDQRGALPGHHGGPVRRGRAGDRAAAGPAAARPAGGAGGVLRRPRGARRGDGLQLRHLAALPGRAGHAGAVQVVRRAQGGGHPAGAAARPSRWSPRTPG